MDGLCTLYPPKRKFMTSFKWRAAATTTATAIKTSKKQYIYMYTTPRLNFTLRAESASISLLI